MDLRLLPLALGLWLSTCGSLLVLSQQHIFSIFIWLTALVLISFALIKKQQLKTWNIVSSKFLILGLGCGLLISFFRLQPLISGPLHIGANEQAIVQVTGELIDDPRRSKITNSLDLGTRDFGLFKLRVTRFEYRSEIYQVRIPVQVFVSGENLTRVWKLPPGTKLRFIGKLDLSDPARAVAAKITATNQIEIVQTPRNYQFLASNFRTGLHKALDRFNPEPAGLVPGLALGDNSALTEQLALNMKAAGLTHLTAVSGSNVTLLIALALAIGRKFRFVKQTNYLIALTSLAAFVVVVRPQPSVLRASVMGVIMVFALMSKSPKSPLPALTASVIVLVLIDPWLAISYGFALSVFATAGLLLWAKSLIISFDRLLPRRIPEWLVLGLVVTISAQVAVFPILVGLGSPLSLGSLPANLVAVPLAGPTMVLGILAAVTAQIFFPLGQMFAWLATLPAGVIVFLANYFAKQKWLIIPWPNGAGGILLAVVLIILGVQLKLVWPDLKSDQKQLVLTSWLLFIWLLWQPPTVALRNWVPSNWQIVSCNVGQGDATVIRVSKHEAIVVDVGGDPELIDECLTKLKITKIPLLLLTHFHADHVVGLPGALAGRDIGQIRISPLADPKLTTKFVYDVFAQNNKVATILAYPEYLKIGEVELFCIWPKIETSDSNNTPNNASVSLLIRTANISLLLPGDIEPIAQEGIIDLVGNLKVDVIKVPHHGSRYQSTEFAKLTDPDLALISVGKHNDYGHPAVETIFLYESGGAKVIRTDEHGSIAVFREGQKLLVSSEN